MAGPRGLGGEKTGSHALPAPSIGDPKHTPLPTPTPMRTPLATEIRGPQRKLKITKIEAKAGPNTQ